MKPVLQLLAASALSAGMVIGAAVASVPKTTQTVYVQGAPYYYANGVYYQPAPSGSGYVVVQAPPGASLPSLPPSAVSVQANGQSYEYLNGIFYQGGYTSSGQYGYTVVQAPIGATVNSLPQGAQSQVVNGAKFFTYGSTWFRAFYSGNETVYMVVQNPAA